MYCTGNHFVSVAPTTHNIVSKSAISVNNSITDHLQPDQQPPVRAIAELYSGYKGR